MNYTSKEVLEHLQPLLDFINGKCTNDEAGRKCLGFLMQHGEQLVTILRSMEEAKAVACPYCDDTGDVHSIDGEWRGECTACHPPVDSCEAKDAARYRYLRDAGKRHAANDEISHRIWLGGIELDNEIDSAMTAESREN